MPILTTNTRRPDGPIGGVVIAVLLLAWAAPNTIRSRISPDYWHWAALIAIPSAILLAWLLHRMLVDSWYKPRFADVECQMSSTESWVTGILSAVVLVTLATFDLANTINQVIGHPYVANYRVTDKYILQGKHPCYGLSLINVDDPEDQFKFCASQEEQETIAIDAVLRVNGRRSRYIDQLIDYTVSH